MTRSAVRRAAGLRSTCPPTASCSRTTLATWPAWSTSTSAAPSPSHRTRPPPALTKVQYSTPIYSLLDLRYAHIIQGGRDYRHSFQSGTSRFGGGGLVVLGAHRYRKVTSSASKIFYGLDSFFSEVLNLPITNRKRSKRQKYWIKIRLLSRFHFDYLKAVLNHSLNSIPTSQCTFDFSNTFFVSFANTKQLYGWLQTNHVQIKSPRRFSA